VAIGAPGFNIGNSLSTSGAGLVYLYTYSLEDKPELQATLLPPSSFVLQSFGWQVNLLPSHLVVSAPSVKYDFSCGADGATFIAHIDGEISKVSFQNSDDYQTLSPVASKASGCYGYATSIAVLDGAANAELLIGEPFASIQFTNGATSPVGNVYSYVIPLPENGGGGGGPPGPRAANSKRPGPQGPAIGAIGAVCGLASVGLAYGAFFLAKKMSKKGFVPLASAELLGKHERL